MCPIRLDPLFFLKKTTIQITKKYQNSSYRSLTYAITFSGLLKGQKLLDIGTGPVVYPIITASKWFDEIYLSDLSQANVEFLQRWRRGNAEPMKFIMEWAAQKEK